MGFLSQLFGSKVSVVALQRAVEQKRYADAHYLAGELNRRELSESDKQTVKRLGAEAGDGLARLNLMEAVSKQQNGETELASQHFDLALEYVSTPALRGDIEQARHRPWEVVTSDASDSESAGGTSAPVVPASVEESGESLADDAIRFELILSTYPPSLKKCYENRGGVFVKAFLASQEGDSAQAYQLFKQVEEPGRDEIYWFEVGSLLARLGEMAQARQALERALQQNPQMMPAVEAQVEVLLELGQADAALEWMQQRIKDGAETASQSHALLVTIYARQEAWQEAAEHVRPAVEGGYNDPAFISLAALVMEKNRRLDEAESLFAQLSTGGGCRGKTNLHLAEFYLRNNRNLEQAFASFNAAVKQEPANPRWTLRLAQTCFARQWHKDGMQLLTRLANGPELDPELQTQVEQLLSHHGMNQGKL